MTSSFETPRREKQSEKRPLTRRKRRNATSSQSPRRNGRQTRRGGKTPTWLVRGAEVVARAISTRARLSFVEPITRSRERSGARSHLLARRDCERLSPAARGALVATVTPVNRRKDGAVFRESVAIRRRRRRRRAMTNAARKCAIRAGLKSSRAPVDGNMKTKQTYLRIAEDLDRPLGGIVKDSPASEAFRVQSRAGQFLLDFVVDVACSPRPRRSPENQTNQKRLMRKGGSPEY